MSIIPVRAVEMLIVIDPHSGVPVYRQLMDQIKFHIATGLLKPGDELPSTRNLSTELGINPMTISKAYSYLERDNVVERRRGRPLVVRALDRDEITNRKIEQLRSTLIPVARMVKQMDIDDGDAIRIFKELLHNAGDMPANEEGEDKS
jgi:GntR family transcriptional regulator